MKSFVVLKSTIIVASLTLIISACNPAYLSNSDRITQGAGNAVKANLEGQTIDPSSDEQYDVSGLGKDGGVIPPPVEGGAEGE
ncbi:MAG: hypothetical protein L3J21_12675 [Devosiaceae bacterium]|nr:hypothetical protein [Devosiaceae bacterium]